MFAKVSDWLLSWFSRGPRIDTYRPRDRMIYTYHDGQKYVRADPLVLYKRVMDVGPELSVDVKVATSISSRAPVALTSVVGRVREIFNVKTLADGGLTDVEVLVLLDHFMLYCDALEKKTPPSATPATGTSPTSESSSAGSPGTTSSPASGSTEDVPSSAAPASSRSEPG